MASASPSLKCPPSEAPSRPSVEFLDAAREVALDRRAAALTELVGDLPADGLEAGLDAELRDAGAHRAQPDDPDPGDLHPAILASPRGLRPLPPVGP